jgi:hypothetical protein
VVQAASASRAIAGRKRIGGMRVGLVSGEGTR